MIRHLTNNSNWWFTHPTMMTGGVTYAHILDSAMVMLFDENQSIILKGEVFQKVEELIDFEHDSPKSAIGFDRNQAEQMLYYANYPVDDLVIDAECQLNLNAYAWANLGTIPILARRLGHIWMNPFTMNRDARNGGLPDNAEGVDIMTYWSAAVFLHELMHVMGFTHSLRMDNTPTHPYNRTLPQVAYRAVLNVSPYRQSFFLTSQIDPLMHCGTSSANAAFDDNEGELPPSIELPPEIKALKSSAAHASYLFSTLAKTRNP